MIKMLTSTSPPLVTYIYDYHDDHHDDGAKTNQFVWTSLTMLKREKELGLTCYWAILLQEVSLTPLDRKVQTYKVDIIEFRISKC